MSLIANLPAFEKVLNKRFAKRPYRFQYKIGDDINLADPNITIFQPSLRYLDYGTFEPVSANGTGTIVATVSQNGEIINHGGTGYPFLILDAQDIVRYPEIVPIIKSQIYLSNIVSKYSIKAYSMPSHKIEVKGLPIKFHVTN